MASEPNRKHPLAPTNMAPYLRSVLVLPMNMAFPVSEVNAPKIITMFLRSRRQDIPDKATVKNAPTAKGRDGVELLSDNATTWIYRADDSGSEKRDALGVSANHEVVM